MLRNNIVKRMTKKQYYNDRLIFGKISARPVYIVIVQVYKPTTDHNNDEIEKYTMRSVIFCIKKEEIK